MHPAKIKYTSPTNPTHHRAHIPHTQTEYAPEKILNHFQTPGPKTITPISA